MKPGDMLLWRDHYNNRDRFWEVVSVLLGAEGQEGLVRLRPITDRPGFDEDGNRQDTVLVPEVLLRSLEIFTPLRVEVFAPVSVEVK